MTCLEAQSNIMAFIDKKLPEENISDFVRHIRYCPNCAEELEIYYTLIVGMRQLDSGGELSQNFKGDLNQELDRIDNKVRKVKRFKTSSVGIAFIALVLVGWFLYTACLAKVYSVEQRILKERQGDTFNYDYFGEYMEICDRDLVFENKPVEVIEEEPTIYEYIRKYNNEHAKGVSASDDINDTSGTKGNTDGNGLDNSYE